MSPVARIRVTAPGLFVVLVAGVEVVGAADVLVAGVEVVGAADVPGVGASVVVEPESEVVEEGAVGEGAVEEGAVAIEELDWLVVSVGDEAKPPVVGGAFVVVSAIPKGA